MKCIIIHFAIESDPACGLGAWSFSIWFSSIYLFIAASDPTCGRSGSTDDSPFVSMWCSVSFRGNWAPVMTWKNQQDGIISEGITNTTHPNFMIMYTLKVSKEDFENSPSYKCVTEFTTSMKPPTVNATNTPKYTSKCVVSYGINNGERNK